MHKKLNSTMGFGYCGEINDAEMSKNLYRNNRFFALSNLPICFINLFLYKV